MKDQIQSALVTIAATFFVEIGNALYASQSIEWTVAGVVGLFLAAARAAIKVALSKYLIK